jgi:hypothetical protein
LLRRQGYYNFNQKALKFKAGSTTAVHVL